MIDFAKIGRFVLKSPSRIDYLYIEDDNGTWSIMDGRQIPYPDHASIIFHFSDLRCDLLRTQSAPCKAFTYEDNPTIASGDTIM